MSIVLFLIPFMILTKASDSPVDLEPIFRQDGFKIPGYDGVCSIIPRGCLAHSTNCMTASCNTARGNVCWGVGRELNSFCEDWMHDIDDNIVAVPGVCVEGQCVHVPDEVHCPEGKIVAHRTFPSCGDLGFHKTFRFASKEETQAQSYVMIGKTEESFGPDLEFVTVTTSQTINDGDYGVALVDYLDVHYGDCIVGHSSNCKIRAKGSYNLMGMTVKWDPSSVNTKERVSSMEIDNQVIELKPFFKCSTRQCRTTIEVKGTSPTPCGDTQLTCQEQCLYRVEGFVTYPELNGDYVERVSGINGFAAYTKINTQINAAKALNANEWWFDDDLADYDSLKQTANVKAYLGYSPTQNPFQSKGPFQAFEVPAQGSSIMRLINIRQKCKSDPGPCGSIEALYSTHKFWTAAYGTVRFTPPDYRDADVKEKPFDPYNVALLGDVFTAEYVEFSVEVTFVGQMAGILVFGSENSYVMCRLDSAKKPHHTGMSIVEHPNTVVVNGKEKNGQLSNPENVPIIVKITIHENVVTCYSAGLGETSRILPRVSGDYNGINTGRVGFATLNAAASFRILGCPKVGEPIDPPLPPCLPPTPTTRAPITTESVSGDDDDDDGGDDDDDDDGGDDDDDDDGGNDDDSSDKVNTFLNYDFYNYNFGTDSNDDVEKEVGDSNENQESDSKDSKDSSEDPDNGPTCYPDSASDSKDSTSDSFDVEAAIGVQTQSLTHAVFEDRVLYMLASVGVASSLIMMYRYICTKADYEVVAEPQVEEL